MSFRTAKFFLIIAVALTAGAGNGAAQSSADNLPMNRSNLDESRPRTIRDSMDRMRIEKEKKDFDRMIDRGEEAARIAAELDTAYAQNGRLTEKEIAKLASVEKLAKQIRSDLGGGDDDELKNPADPAPSVAEAVKALRDSAEDLFSELKKISRFTISATAIQSSNAVLKLARFARVAR